MLLSFLPSLSPPPSVALCSPKCKELLPEDCPIFTVQRFGPRFLCPKTLSCDVHYDGGHSCQLSVNPGLPCRSFQVPVYVLLELVPFYFLCELWQLCELLWIALIASAGSKQCQQFMSFDGSVHCRPVRRPVLAVDVSDTRRLWALWFVSRPGSSCVSPEIAPAIKHLIQA